MAKDTRVDKLFSNLGLMTRSRCKKAVRAGEITVNGRVCSSESEKLDPDLDMICLNGEPVDSRRLVYYMLNKPEGYITANDDRRFPVIFELIKDSRADLSAVGRLDKDTSGIILITNDGQLNHRLLSPKYHVEKTYSALIDGVLSDTDIAALTFGLDIGDDRPTLPARLEIIRKEAPQRVLLTITEGRYHQVKRMFAAVGKPVLSLSRKSFGPLELDPSLEPGEYRELTAEELKALRNCPSAAKL